jgi:hypothetical protein
VSKDLQENQAVMVSWDPPALQVHK